MTEKPIDLQEMQQLAAQHQIWAIRAHAIQQYANLEQSLCRLFAGLGDIKHDIAAVIFFKITSFQVRNAIIERLFKKKFKSEYSLFRNSLVDQLHPIDIQRNAIVHWSIVNQIQSATEFEVVLRPPNIWDMNENTPLITTADLLAFMQQCSFYARLINMFCLMADLTPTAVPIPDAGKRPWLDIFARPIEYPPPDTHPLSPNYKAHETPPQSSQA